MTIALIPSDDLNDAIHTEEGFEKLLDEWDMETILATLKSLVRDIGLQLEDGAGLSPGWRGRARNKKTKAEDRIVELKLMIKERNREHSATIEAHERKWSRFAQRLATVLDEIDPTALYDIVGPGGAPDFSAKHWLARRREMDKQKNRFTDPFGAWDED